MEEQHRQIINYNLSDLIMFTYDIEAIVNSLFEKNIINKWMKDHIMKPEEDRTQKLRFFKLIQGRGPKAFLALCRTLEDTSNIAARNIMLSTKTFEPPNAEYKKSDLNISITDINLNGRENVNIEEQQYVKIHPERRRMDIDDKNLPTGAYPMGSNPKGYALILNINKVIDKQERTGSNVDVVNLQKLFEGLGYEVQSEIDSTAKEIEVTIKEFIKSSHNVKIDSIVVFIMSHGEAGKDSSRSSDILTSDGVKINTDWIIEQFEPNKIKRNIPKLFFIQACRGENSDFGWKPFDIENNRLQNDTTSNIGNIVDRRYENVFIAYATVPGYNAKRDPIDGSWFVQKLCEVIREYSWEFDLNSIMKKVDVEIRKLNSINHGFQTVEWTYRGFNKKFYFNPGLYDDNSDHAA